jgi:hypothetical protein
MTFSLGTALLALLGWLSHWLASWGEAWKHKRYTLVDFIEENPPAFWLSITTTIAIYLMGATVLQALGVKLPNDPSMQYVVAFIACYMADSIVYKLSNLIKR